MSRSSPPTTGTSRCCETGRCKSNRRSNRSSRTSVAPLRRTRRRRSIDSWALRSTESRRTSNRRCRSALRSSPPAPRRPMRRPPHCRGLRRSERRSPRRPASNTRWVTARSRKKAQRIEASTGSSGWDTGRRRSCCSHRSSLRWSPRALGGCRVGRLVSRPRGTGLRRRCTGLQWAVRAVRAPLRLLR
jgi:hypothetical protein